ncbi:acyltransferase [Micromonospora sp. M12]
MRIIAEPDYKAVVDALFTLGLSGVQFFFILSGFVLVWSARPGDSRLTFWRRRIAKIYPNHLVLFGATLLVAWWFADPVLPAAALENVLLLQAWDPRPGWFYSINTVSWSLSCEFFFYLCLPLVLPLLRRARPKLLWVLIVALPLLILALWPAQQLVPEVSRWWFTQIFPPVRSLEFWLGAVAAELMRRGSGAAPADRGQRAVPGDLGGCRAVDPRRAVDHAARDRVPVGDRRRRGRRRAGGAHRGGPGRWSGSVRSPSPSTWSTCW